MTDQLKEPLRFGVFFSPIHSSRRDPAVALARDIETMVKLETLGYDEIWIGEHHSTGWEYVGAPEVMIAHALAHTQRIRFGTGVVSIPYHNPFMVAERMLLLDHLSRGRVIPGVGPGALPYDAHMIGVDVMETRRYLEEGLEVVLALFRGESVTRRTDWFDLRDARLQLPPYAATHMEVAVSSTASPSGPKLAGRHGTSLLSFNATGPGAAEALRGRWSIVEDEAAAHGKTVSRTGWRLVAPMFLAETRDEAFRLVRRGLEEWFYYLIEVSALLSSAAKAILPDGIDASNPDALVQAAVDSGFVIVGTPEDAIAAISKMQDDTGGVGAVLLWSNDWATPEEMDRSYSLFAEEVIPVFQHRTTALRRNEEWVKTLHGDMAAQALQAREKAASDYARERSNT